MCVVLDQRNTTTILPLVEEEIRIEKREVVTGSVRVRTVTDTAEQLVEQELRSENAEIQYVPVGRYVEAGAETPKIRTVDGVTIIPIFEEVLVVEKRLFVKQEIHIRHLVTTEISQIPVALRKQRAVVERLNSEGEKITEPIAAKETES